MKVPGSLLVAGLLVAATLAPCYGKVIKVTHAKDNNGGSCPGSTCNLRAAWDAAGLNDTILLTVNPVMYSNYGPLVASTGWQSFSSGTVTVMGPTAGGAVIHGGRRFLALSYYPYSASTKVKLVFKNIEFTGFNSKRESDNRGLIFCFSPASNYCAQQSRKSGATLAKSGRASLGAKGQQTGPLGEDQTRFGNWTQLRKNAMLEVVNCVFRNNHMHTSSSNSDTSMVYTESPNGANLALPLVFTSSQFVNNTAGGYASPIGSVIGGDTYSGGGVPLMISKCTFANNVAVTTEDDSNSLIESLQGPVIGVLGPISIYGSNFVGNTVGASRAVVSAGNLDNESSFHVYIYDSSFLNNGANGEAANDAASTIIGGWIILHKVNMVLPASVPPVATRSKNDQYMHECSLMSTTGKAVYAAGFQIYNRNPIYTNLANSTDGTGSNGFANCEQGAAWLPCRKGTDCTTLTNPTLEVVVGYACN